MDGIVEIVVECFMMTVVSWCGDCTRYRGVYDLLDVDWMYSFRIVRYYAG